MKKRIISVILLVTVFVCSLTFSAGAQPLFGITDAGVTNAQSLALKGDTVYPEFYSAYREGLLLERTQDQLSTSVCWAFVQNELLHANLMKKTGVSYDFSEETMKFETSYTTEPQWGYLRAPNDGGNEFISTAYLARVGSTLESDEPFTESAVRTVDGDSLTRYGYLDHTLFFEYEPYDPDKYGLSYAEILLMKEAKAEAILKIKELVTEYGAVGAGMYYEQGPIYENTAKTNYCYTGNVMTPNHSVTIVGWDDNYPAEDFKQTPEGNGAFLIKNSWGNYHNGGRTSYCWVSYYDKLITYQLFATDYEIQNDVYDNAYMYDGYGWTQNGFVRGSSVMCISKFNANKLSEKLSAVSAYVTDGGTTMEVMVNVSGDIDDPFAYKTVSKAYYEDAGYYFIEFEPMELERAEYYVAIRLTTSSDITYFALQGKVSGLVPDAKNTPDTCFVATDFTDITPIEDVYKANGAMLCIKSFTQNSDISFAPSGKEFSDVKRGKWYSDEIEYCVSRGIFSGVSETHFAPDTPMTRAMFVTVLANLSGEEIWESSHPFTDVASDRWYTDEVCWAYENGIVSGVTATTFCPDDSITREQMCFMLLKFCDYKGIALRSINQKKVFTDAALIRSYAREAVALCQTAGIISGMTDGSFAPRKSATRAEVAVLLTGLAKNYIY